MRVEHAILSGSDGMNVMTSAGHEDVRVAFAQQMIPHQQQAIGMAKAAETPSKTGASS